MKFKGITVGTYISKRPKGKYNEITVKAEISKKIVQNVEYSPRS